jgi:hypothetical protein
MDKEHEGDTNGKSFVKCLMAEEIHPDQSTQAAADQADTQ